MSRRAPAIRSAAIAERLVLIEQALEAQLQALGPRPRSWRELADAFALGRTLEEAREARAAVLDIYACLFASADRPIAARQRWIDALVAAAAARALAAALRGSPSTAALAALVSHAAEALVLRAIGVVEVRQGPRLDQASVAAVIGPLAPVAAAAICRQWKLPATLAAAARDVNGVPEQRSPSSEARAVYFARLLAGTRLGRGFAAPGLEYELRAALGVGARELAVVRSAAAAAERVAEDLARHLASSAGFEAAG